MAAEAHIAIAAEKIGQIGPIGMDCHVGIPPRNDG